MKLLFTALFSLCLTACANDLTARQSVIEAFKTSEVQKMPSQSDYYFLARTPDGAVWLVETYALDGTIYAKTLIFPATQPEAK